jgi:hypothetical protein
MPTPEQEAFKQELDLRAAERQNITAAEQTASFRETAEYMRDRINPSDPKSLYFGKPREAAQALAQLDASYIKAGISKAGAPDPVAIGREATVMTMPIDRLPDGLQAAIDIELQRIDSNPFARDAAASELKQTLGAVRYNELVANARAYKRELTPAELASHPALRAYAAQATIAQRAGKK